MAVPRGMSAGRYVRATRERGTCGWLGRIFGVWTIRLRSERSGGPGAIRVDLNVLQGYSESFSGLADVDGLTVDGASLLVDPAFWAAHYLNQTIEDEDLVTRVWGIDRSTIRAMRDRLNDDNAWPAFEVELGGDAKLVVVYRNLSDDAGVDYLLMPDLESDSIRIATLEGAYEGPGISWNELSVVANRFAEPTRRAEVLMLLAPILGDADAESPDVVAAIAHELRIAGASGDVDAWASLIVSENLQWEPAQWSTTASGVVVCDGDESPRNPDSAVALSEEELATVPRLLSA
jgi:hypothetical protein